MDNKYNLYVTLNDNGTKYHYYLRFDQSEKHLVIYHLIDLLGDDEKRNLPKLKEIFKAEPNNTVSLTSAALIKFVDGFGGITFNGRKIDGKQALAEVKNDNFAEVLSALGVEISGRKNLMFTMPGIFKSIKDGFETDLNMMKTAKIMLDEAPKLKNWKIELIKVNKDNVSSI